MGPIFASPDIAALVAAFPPILPDSDRPGLVRTRSGNNVKDSRKVVADFRALLETSTSRVKIADLPSRLDIADVDWLLSGHSTGLCTSRDELSILPKQTADKFLQEVFNQLENAAIEAQKLQHSHDINDGSLQKILENDSKAPRQEVLRLVDSDGSGETYYYRLSYFEALKNDFRAKFPASGTERINVTTAFPNVPSTLLRHVLQAVIENDAASGSMEFDDGHVVYVPAGFAESLIARQKIEHEEKVTAAVNQLSGLGFLRLPENDADLQEVKDRVASVDVEKSIAEQGCIVLFTSPELQSSVETLRAAASATASDVWRQRDGSETQPILIDRCLEALASQATSDIANAVLETQYRDQVSSELNDCLADLQRNDSGLFSEMLRARLLAPVALYTGGISSIHDTTLKQHLEEFLGEHFRREVVPAVIASLRDHNLIIEKGRRREVEKMQQACTESKTLSDIQAASTRLARKQKIEAPSNEMLKQIKQETMSQRAKATRKMSRGSDLLQNLIWLLLARDGHGLLMSPGKDTTRMIKQYQTVGDGDIARKLEGWRDLLKTGKERNEDLQEMRELAANAANTSQNSH